MGMLQEIKGTWVEMEKANTQVQVSKGFFFLTTEGESGAEPERSRRQSRGNPEAQQAHLRPDNQGASVTAALTGLDWV